MAINSVTKVELFDYDGDLKKGWYVGFKYVHPHSGKSIYAQVRGQINYYKTKSERREHGGYLVTLVKEALSQGWEPYKETVYDFLVNTTDQKEPGLNFKSALDLALSKGFWSSKTKRDYSCAARLFTSACSALSMIEKPIDEFSRKDIISMGDWLLKNRDSWSPKAYNKNMCYLKALFSILEDREIIKDNPVRRIKNMAVTETRKYEPYTKEEKKAIQAHLYLNHYRYFVYFLTIYHTGMRPKEVLSLRIRDVKMAKREIVIIPDAEEENSKTKSERTIPLDDEIFGFFLQMQLENFPSDWFVFGSPGIPGRGKRGSWSAVSDGYFTPQPTRIKRDTTTRFWQRVVKAPLDKGGLGIDKYQYAAKHTGADDKIMAGVDIRALQSMYGHASAQMTERYVTKLKEVHKKNIIDQSPSFV